MMASYTRWGASRDVMCSSGCRSASLKSTRMKGSGISASVAAASSASSIRLAWLCTLSISTHHASRSFTRRSSNTCCGGSVLRSAG